MVQTMSETVGKLKSFLRPVRMMQLVAYDSYSCAVNQISIPNKVAFKIFHKLNEEELCCQQ